MVDGEVEMSDNGILEKYCNDDYSGNCDTYGGLYQWGELMQYSTSEGAQGICPSGWHLPSDEEWKQLEGSVDSQYAYPDPVWDNNLWRGSDAGRNLKSTYSWTNGVDLFGFTALSGGFRYAYSGFFSPGLYGDFWSSTEYGVNYAFYRRLYDSNDGVLRGEPDKRYGMSARCVRD